MRDLEDLEDSKEKDDMNCAGDSETPKSQNVDCTSMDESSDKPSISKKKATHVSYPQIKLEPPSYHPKKSIKKSPNNTNAKHSNNDKHSQSQSNLDLSKGISRASSPWKLCSRTPSPRS